jgi:AraC-like DNA-binding protein
MTARDLTAFALASIIAAELVLFAAFLLSSRQRPASATYLLASLALCLAMLVAGNLLIGFAGLTWLSDALLFIDLLAPPLLYLYVLAIRQTPRPLALTEIIHAAPAVLGIILWKARLVGSMDIYVNACWLGYLMATAVAFVTGFERYAPRARQRVLMLLFGVLIAIWLLRLVIVAQAASQPSFRDGLPYLLVLAATFGATCIVLLTALRHPDLLSVPGSHVKYALSSADAAGLDELHGKLEDILDREQPFLDPDFSLAELAALLDAPARHVSQLINARYDMNVSAYINLKRAKVAAELLAGTPKPIKVIMFEAGFRSKSIFNREFQRSFGASPSEYRRRAQGQGKLA